MGRKHLFGEKSINEWHRSGLISWECLKPAHPVVQGVGFSGDYEDPGESVSLRPEGRLAPGQQNWP